MLRCDKRVFEQCPDKEYCGSLGDAVFFEGSECDKYNREVIRAIERQTALPLMLSEVRLIRGEYLWFQTVATRTTFLVYVEETRYGETYVCTSNGARYAYDNLCYGEKWLAFRENPNEGLCFTRLNRRNRMAEHIERETSLRILNEFIPEAYNRLAKIDGGVDNTIPRGFKVGDRVVVVKNEDSLVAILGLHGTVKKILGGFIGVEFDSEFFSTYPPHEKYGHNLDDALTSDNGWWMSEDELELVPETNDAVEKSVYYNGEIICVNSNDPTEFTVGKIYTVVDGLINNPNRGDTVPTTRAKSLEQLNFLYRPLEVNFIPLVKD